MIVHHVALTADWGAANVTGSYTTSTLGRSLDDEGFIHCSTADQLAGVMERFYADVEEPLTLLSIDTDRLTSPWRLDPVGDDGEEFPHVYGPINRGAVVESVPILRA